MSGVEPHAEVIPIGRGRPRCGAVGASGRPCRNHAGPSGRCHVHRDLGEPPPEAAEPSSQGRTTGAPTEDGEVLQEAWRALRGIISRVTGMDDSEISEDLMQVVRFAHRRLVGDYEVDVYGFDRELTEQVLLPLARPLYHRYWRVTTSGIQHVPSDSGALLVANHGGVVPFDAVMTKVALLDDHPAGRHLRELAADLALRVPIVGPLARKSGNTLAHTQDAMRLLDDNELVGVWPEGFKGVGKHYRDRYKLQRFGRGGFVEVALRTGKPIIPVAIVGAEEIYPMVGNAKALARLLGLPYFPITWTFPALGPLGLVPLPSKWTITFGAPIETASHGPDAADDPMLVFELTEHVRDQIQQMLYRALMRRRSVFL